MWVCDKNEVETSILQSRSIEASKAEPQDKCSYLGRKTIFLKTCNKHTYSIRFLSKNEQNRKTY